MVAKLLIVDPDITFAIGVKRSLEQTGDYEVMALGTGGGALEHMRGSRYDAVLIDFNITDMELGAFIKALRALNPALVILISPRNGAQIQQLAALRVQGSIPKPYYARQLAPILKQALRANVTTQTPKAVSKMPPTMAPEEPLPPITRTVPSVSADFDAAIAVLPALIVEPPVAPDDTFRRHLAAMLPDKPATPAGLRRTLDSVDLSQTAISDEATIADVVSGKPLSDPPAPADFTPAPAEPIEDAPAAALNTMQMLAADELSLGGMADKLEETTGMPAPGWMRAEPADEPGFVRKAIDDRAPTGPMQAVSQALEPAPGDPIDTIDSDSPAIDNTINSNPGDPIAQVAAALTQLSVGSTARATLLTRGAGLIAAAGNLSGEAATSAAALIDQAWQGGDNSGSTLVRYLSIPGYGDFLLFSTQTIEDMRLSMFFAADTPMKAIRKQARQLLDALANPVAVPQVIAEAAPVADFDPAPADTDPDKLSSDETLLTRPTLPIPPEGLREAIAAGAPLVTVALPAPVQATYSIVLAPRSGAFKPDILAMVPLWLTERCLELGYQIEGVQSQTAFLQFQLGLPDTQTPAFALKQLLDGTSARAADPHLWQPGYYIAAPARTITQQEIMFFLNYQKAAAS